MTERLGAGRNWNVVELRRYRLHAGRREDLIGLFDRHFVEPQEEVGMRVLGQFRDLDDPDRFVWLRAFPDMESRTESLSAFYLRHPAWREHREAANATMADSDDVLLLRPAVPGGSLLDAAPGARPVAGVSSDGTGPQTGLITVEVHHFAGEAELEEFRQLFEERIRPVLTACGAPPLGGFRTEYAENGFPALPVRTGEHVFVHLRRFRDPDDHRRFADRLRRVPEWRDAILPQVGGLSAKPAEELRLTPTARSALR